VRVNVGELDWTFEVELRARLVIASDPTIEARGRSVCLPPSSVAVFETPLV
jgi:hypothetical protein